MIYVEFWVFFFTQYLWLWAELIGVFNFDHLRLFTCKLLTGSALCGSLRGILFVMDLISCVF